MRQGPLAQIAALLMTAIGLAGCTSRPPTVDTVKVVNLAGTVSGDDGRRLSGATVGVRGSNGLMTTTSGSDGEFSLRGIAIGDETSLTVTVNMPGYQPNNVPVAIDRRRSDFTVAISLSASISPPVSLVIESFSMGEYLSSDGFGTWEYVPLVEFATSGSFGTATLLRINVSIPGFLPGPAVCSGRQFTAGQSGSLIGEAYGDWEITFDWPGHRATPDGLATITLMTTDGEGTSNTLTASGPIVASAPPTTYSGGAGGWTSCRPSNPAAATTELRIR